MKSLTKYWIMFRVYKTKSVLYCTQERGWCCNMFILQLLRYFNFLKVDSMRTLTNNANSPPPQKKAGVLKLNCGGLKGSESCQCRVLKAASTLINQFPKAAAVGDYWQISS